MGIIHSYPFLEINENGIFLNIYLPNDNYRALVHHFIAMKGEVRLENYIRLLEKELRINELKIKPKWDGDLGLTCISYEASRLCLDEKEMKYKGENINFTHVVPLFFTAIRYRAMLVEGVNHKKKRGIQFIP